MAIKLPVGGASPYVSTSRDNIAMGRVLPLSTLENTGGVVEIVEKPVRQVEEAAEENAFPLDAEEQREAVKRTSELVSMLDRDLKFEVHDDSGIVQIQVIDTTDGRVIRKIPADEVLKLVASIREKMSERVDVKA
jgi:flagellar protein FlaG